ncbi:GNAT family N-acetyltransferase [Maribacter aurantiacus]|uniref:GNAT family N-acetyltransferase n=1 Tax=Maribacter aurantiacus TaxID=1882343 RepID=A0A5R8LNY4_9FLAO|nr:GNAT family N-acetyltransferase [Maribacter aurantiacus]TLF38946.1 GNAT family N-acetyltransferase [Maribacter aurantiacus]
MEFEINTIELPTEKELENLFSQTTWASERKSQNIRRMLNNVNVFVTIRKNSELIGFGRAISDGIYRALVDDIIVDNDYRKKGLGKIIVENILKQLNGIDEIFLNTKPDLEQFYKKFGFNKANTITMKKSIKH